MFAEGKERVEQLSKGKGGERDKAQPRGRHKTTNNGKTHEK
jgi:hypothetical protein